MAVVGGGVQSPGDADRESIERGSATSCEAPRARVAGPRHPVQWRAAAAVLRRRSGEHPRGAQAAGQDEGAAEAGAKPPAVPAAALGFPTPPSSGEEGRDPSDASSFGAPAPVLRASTDGVSDRLVVPPHGSAPSRPPEPPSAPPRAPLLSAPPSYSLPPPPARSLASPRSLALAPDAPTAPDARSPAVSFAPAPEARSGASLSDLLDVPVPEGGLELELSSLAPLREPPPGSASPAPLVPPPAPAPPSGEIVPPPSLGLGRPGDRRRAPVPVSELLGPVVARPPATLPPRASGAPRAPGVAAAPTHLSRGCDAPGCSRAGGYLRKCRRRQRPRSTRQWRVSPDLHLYQELFLKLLLARRIEQAAASEVLAHTRVSLLRVRSHRVALLRTNKRRLRRTRTRLAAAARAHPAAPPALRRSPLRLRALARVALALTRRATAVERRRPSFRPTPAAPVRLNSRRRRLGRTRALGRAQKTRWAHYRVRVARRGRRARLRAVGVRGVFGGLCAQLRVVGPRVDEVGPARRWEEP